MSARTVIFVTIFSAFSMIHPPLSNAQENCVGECQWDPCHWSDRLRGICAKPLYDDPRTYFEEEAKIRFDIMRGIGGACTALHNGIYGRPSSYVLHYNPPELLCVTPNSYPFFGPTALIEFFYAGGVRCHLTTLSIDPVCDHTPLHTKLLLLPLSGPSETDQILTSVEPTKTTDTLLAKVINTKTNEIIPNVDIKLELDIKKDSGGHIHAEHNPIVTSNVKGKLQSVNTLSTPDMFGTLEGNTGDQGFQYTYEAPKPASDIKITGSCTSRHCGQKGSDTVWVGIKGLWELQSSSSYMTIPCALAHSDCHHLTRAAAGTFNIVSRVFRSANFGVEGVHVGDASLERGGMFDIGGNWTSPYASHRQGRSVDVYFTQADPTNSSPGTATRIPSFYVIAKNRGMTLQEKYIEDPELRKAYEVLYFHVEIRR